MSRFLFVALGVLIAPLAHAQTILPGTPTASLEINPSFPSGQELITVTAVSNSVDLQRTSISWYVDDELHSEGPALTTISVPVGAPGSQTDIVAIITSTEGVARAERSVRPAAVDLLWEVRSYSPPFYRGRSLPSPGSTVVAAANARIDRLDGTRVEPNDIIYTWKRNGAIVASQSGRGKLAATFPAPFLFGEDTLSVEIETIDGMFAASDSKVVPSHDPGVALYQDHPLFGILFHEAVADGAVLPETEAAFVAVPYFAAVTTPDDPGFSYDWNVNGTSIPPDPQRPSRFIINAENSDGIAHLELAITHARNIFLSIRDTWRLSFDSRSVFGAPADSGGANTSPFGTPQ